MDRMHSIDAGRQGGEISRPISPKTLPYLYAHSGVAPKTRSQSYSCPPQPPPRLSTTIAAPTTPRSVCQYRTTAFRASSYMLAVQSLDCRPLEELHNERAYLFFNLQKQCQRATRLFERYAAIEARLSGAQTAAEVKKGKREAASIKTKIAESTQQEQLTLLRLGETHIELQNRGRWMQVHHQSLPQPPPLVYPPVCELSLYPDEYTPVTRPSQDFSSCGSALSPLSPCFTPGVVFVEDIWSRASKTSMERETDDWSVPAESDEGDEASQLGQPLERESSQKVEKEVRPEVEREVSLDIEREVSRGESPGDVEETNSSSGWYTDEEEPEDMKTRRARRRKMSLYFPLSLKAKDRRMSVPYMKNLWPRSHRNSLASAG